MAVTITAVDTIQLSIPLDTWAPPPMFAGKPRTHVEAVYVRVTCSNGIGRDTSVPCTSVVSSTPP